MKKIIKLIGILLTTASLASCSENNKKTTFGEFGYKNTFLKEYATKEISVDEAKALVDVPSTTLRAAGTSTKENVEIVLEQYASLITTVKYYIDEKEEQQVRKDIYQGTDFRSLLEMNHYEPFGQMSVSYLFVDDYLLDDLARENLAFHESKQYLVSPFNEPYTFHTNEDNNLIIQVHSFAELPASTSGGIGSTFRQDCELVFNEEGIITFWQSSLGLYTSTPTGTVRQGYIFEVEFEWVSK